MTHEGGAFGVNQVAQLHVVDDADGTLDPAEVAYLAEAAGHGWPRPSLVCVENTHLGPAAGPGRSSACAAVASARACRCTWTAPACSTPRWPPGCRRPTTRAPSVTVTRLPVEGPGGAGGVGAGRAGRRDRARPGSSASAWAAACARSGILAAAGLVALATGVDRLADDHARARLLAEAVAERWPDAGCDPKDVETNIVLFRHDDPVALLRHLAGAGVGAVTLGPRLVRLVTHLDVDDAGVALAVDALRRAP